MFKKVLFLLKLCFFSWQWGVFFLLKPAGRTGIELDSADHSQAIFYKNLRENCFESTIF